MSDVGNVPEQFGARIDDIPIPLLILQPEGLAVTANTAWAELVGRTPVETLGAGWLEALHNADRPRAWNAISGAAASADQMVDEWRLAGAPTRTVSANIRPAADSGVVVAALVETTHWYKRVDDLYQRASHDVLTGLLNRAVLTDRVGLALARCGRTGRPPALLFIDLDGFKSVNDRYGHLAGDKLLAAVAAQLRTAVRETDTLARIGGDEFAVLCEDLRMSQIERLIVRLSRAAARPLRVGKADLSVSISVGVAFADGPADTFEALIDRADRSLYSAKRQR